MTQSLQELRASKIRRVLACGVLVVIGGMFWWVGMQDDQMGWPSRAMMAGFGALWLWGAFELWRGTAGAVILNDTGIVDSSGAQVTSIENIAAIERGIVSMKPSHGMLLKLSESGSAKWVPGLWWRLGARVGIGGLTAKRDTRLFAEALEQRIRTKDVTH